MSTHSVSPAAFQGNRGLMSSAVGTGVAGPVDVGVAKPLESFIRFAECWSGVWEGVLARGEEAAARCINCRY